MEEFTIKFVIAVVTGVKTHDLVIFGPPMVREDGQKVCLEGWIPKTKGARKGHQVTGNPVIGVKEDAELIKSYTKDGGEVPLKTWKLRVDVQGEFGFEGPKTIPLAEFLKNKA